MSQLTPALSPAPSPVVLEVGHGLDGVIARPSVTCHGQLTLGPARLLTWLETRFGQEGPEVSFTARTLEYLACLKERDHDQRFYHQSLEQDDLGVARELLQWRDRWYEAGWRGDAFPESASRRLRDIAEIEELARDRVAAGIGQRVQRVCGALAVPPPEISLVLLDPLETFAPAWQQLFQALGAEARPWAAEVHAPPDSDLARLQAALLNSAESADSPDPVELSGDGSLLVLRDGSPHLSSHWLARYSQRYIEANGSVTAAILAETRGAVFDAARQEASLPRLGFSEPSSGRPVFQVLPLALELLWAPLDPTSLLQFLSHPVGPLSRLLRSRLARVVADQPGIGGTTWRQVMDESIEEVIKHRELEDDKQRDKAQKELFASAQGWLESDRYPGESGAPLDVVAKRVRKVSDWLGSRLSQLEDDAEARLYASALNQASELSTALSRMQETGAPDISRDSLRRLVEAVRGSGISRPDLARECRPGEPQLLRADSPAGVLDPVPLVVWFGCDEARLPRSYPWSRVELAQLRDQGVGLLSLDTLLEWQASSWLRPIFAASDQLVLVLHDDIQGHHPVFDQILSLARGWRERRVDEVIRSQDEEMAGHALPAVELLDVHRLPGPVRWWQLDSAEHLGARESESYTSLEKFMYGPYQWVLRYKADFRAGALAEITDGARLKGTLVHQLFENFFGAHPDIAELDIANLNDNAPSAWVREHLPKLLETDGAVLLEPGRQTEKEDFIEISRRALVELIRHLQLAQVVEIAMEVAHEGRFTGGSLTGIIDLYATNAEGKTALIDIKWGGYKYRRESLEQSAYLQLATYAYLCRKKTKRWPALAYFIITEARMMELDGDYFPTADHVVPKNEEEVGDFWHRAEATWAWRRAQLDTGLIEVPVADTEATERSAPEQAGLPIPDTYDQYNDFAALTGWDPKS